MQTKQPLPNTALEPIIFLRNSHENIKIDTNSISHLKDISAAEKTVQYAYNYEIFVARAVKLNLYYVLYQISSDDEKEMPIIEDSAAFPITEKNRVSFLVKYIQNLFYPHEKDVLKFSGEIYPSMAEIEQLKNKIWSKPSQTKP